MPKTAAEIAGLPRLDTVGVKDVADAAGVSPECVLSRCRRWLQNPRARGGLPYLSQFGRPYRILRDDALRFMGFKP